MRYRASPAQRELIVRLLRGAELPTTITLLHKPALQAAGLWNVSYVGQSIDVLLGELTNGMASRLIDDLKRIQPEV